MKKLNMDDNNDINMTTADQEPSKTVEKVKTRYVELSGNLKKLLAEEIDKAKKREKTRGAEMLAIFAKHNFYSGGFTPEELRTTLEDMGPTYVKIGQIMSSRVDLLPESYCTELGKLRANVKPLDSEVARAMIEQETGKPIDELFSEFRDEPLGSASIAQAHYAVLKDGTEVVVKVQRPLIADMMRKDFVLMKKLASAVNVVSGEDDDKTVDLVSVIREFEKVTEEELDFRVEADNTRYFKEHCIEDENVVNCPTIIDELSTERILTMTYVKGCSISKREKLIEEGCDLDNIGKEIVLNYVHQILDVGYFHADPHQGNIMVSQGVPYWIDFGMVGHITEAMINSIQTLILGLIEMDLDTVVNSLTGLGVTSAKTDRLKLMDDVDGMINKYMGVSNLDEIDMAALMEELTDLAAANYVTLPGEFTMLARSLITIEGVMEELCPQLNLFEIVANKLMERAKQNLDMQQSLLTAGKDALSIGKKAVRIPALAADALTNLSKGRTKFNLELTGYEDLVEQTGKWITNIILVVLACMLFLGSCILCMADIQPKLQNGMPLVAAIGMIIAVALAIFTVRKIRRKK